MEPDIVGTVKAGAGVEPQRRMITESKSQQPLKLTPILVHPDPLISQLNGAALNICMYSGGDDQTVCDARSEERRVGKGGWAPSGMGDADREGRPKRGY